MKFFQFRVFTDFPFSSFQDVLVSPNNEEYELLLDDLKDRVMEHQGETIYVVGTGGRGILEHQMNNRNWSVFPTTVRK